MSGINLCTKRDIPLLGPTQPRLLVFLDTHLAPPHVDRCYLDGHSLGYGHGCGRGRGRTCSLGRFLGLTRNIVNSSRNRNHDIELELFDFLRSHHGRRQL